MIHFESHYEKTKNNIDLVIQIVPNDLVLLNNKTRFNSNNHWPNDKIENVPDYWNIYEQTKTKYWINLFHDRQNYKTIEIEKKNFRWLREAANIGRQTVKFPNSYLDELSELCTFINENNPDIFNSTSKYFVRTENVSLKSGCYGVGPYSSIEQIIKSCITSRDGHSPIKENMEEIRLYLMDWKNINQDKEFRVFVNNGIIKAISQQSLYSSNEFLKKLKEKSDEKFYEKITEWINLIVEYINNVVIKKINHIKSYTIDIALLDNDDPYFIEINPYGAEYSSGSSLFHWIIDENIFNNENKIYVRFSI
jgi:hypothetical protein